MWILSRTAGMSVWTSSVVIAESVDTAFLGGQWWDSAAAGLTPWLKMQQGLLWTQWEASLPVQETWVWPLIWVDPTCCKAAKPLNHNYRACAVDPGNCSCGSLCARELCSATGEATLSEKTVRCHWRAGPACHMREKPVWQCGPSTAKNK